MNIMESAMPGEKGQGQIGNKDENVTLLQCHGDHIPESEGKDILHNHVLIPLRLCENQILYQ